MVGTCERSGEEFTHNGKSPRRRFCPKCVRLVTPSERAAAWRSANPERVSAYNEGRRAPAFPRERVRA